MLHWAGKMAELVKVLAAKAGSLSSIPRTQMMEGENRLSLDLYSYAVTISKCGKLKEKVPYRMNCRTLYCHHEGKLLDHAAKNVFKSLKAVVSSLCHPHVTLECLHSCASYKYLGSWGFWCFFVLLCLALNTAWAVLGKCWTTELHPQLICLFICLLFFGDSLSCPDQPGTLCSPGNLQISNSPATPSQDYSLCHWARHFIYCCFILLKGFQTVWVFCLNIWLCTICIPLTYGGQKRLWDPQTLSYR